MNMGETRMFRYLFMQNLRNYPHAALLGTFLGITSETTMPWRNTLRNGALAGPAQAPSKNNSYGFGATGFHFPE